ncbi:hypothetical protein [Bradyrhizobium viridifuturi]|uniref:hypothetical protein n=1 Tax=Bradyrhizobium viridifuturi TaxID=1654716 RepID=UPI00067E8568|nr:hypothetical protein [Bradyrhizobium viridifuturi]
MDSVRIECIRRVSAALPKTTSPGPTGKFQDEVADQLAQRVVSAILAAEFQDLVDPAEDGLRPFGAGARVGVGRLQVFEEDLDAGFAGAHDVEAGGAGLAPFLVGEGLQVRRAAEDGDGPEQLAGLDRDVERQGVDQADAGRPAIRAVEDVGLEGGERAGPGLGCQAR